MILRIFLGKISVKNSSLKYATAPTKEIIFSLTLFRMGFFGAAHGCGRGQKGPPLPKIYHTYPTMMKLGTVMPYLRKIQNIYESRDTPLEIC